MLMKTVVNIQRVPPPTSTVNHHVTVKPFGETVRVSVLPDTFMSEIVHVLWVVMRRPCTFSLRFIGRMATIFTCEPQTSDRIHPGGQYFTSRLCSFMTGMFSSCLMFTVHGGLLSAVISTSCSGWRTGSVRLL